MKRLLVTNRGEIAMRIIRTARQLGVETVLACSAEDKNSLPTKIADITVCIGSAPAAKSYLNQEVILQTAKSYGCDAIHPGYGFLSENAEFASKCNNAGIEFIGPSHSIIELMGDKMSARKLMKNNGISVVPGSDDNVATLDEAIAVADMVGYPILIKASAGGGGKGMRKACSESELIQFFSEARTEAMNAFGNDQVYIEKYIENPRHIEVQILGDKHGNVIHLGERDCSIQRKNQKMIEESPAPLLSDDIRNAIHNEAIKVAKIVNYDSAGTVEFVYACDGSFYFIEMNTRIQVEHPVTEMVCGIDIVREQMMIADGNEIRYTQSDIEFNGHSIECRIVAEDSENGFKPCPGVVKEFRIPCGCGVRVETALFNGEKVSPWYDSMIAKIITYAPVREESIKKMRTALDELVVKGVHTNISLLKDMIDSPKYCEGDIDTAFIESFIKQ